MIQLKSAESPTCMTLLNQIIYFKSEIDPDIIAKFDELMAE